MAKIVVAVKFKTQQHAPLPTRLQVARQCRPNLLCSLTKQSKKLNINQQPQLRHIYYVFLCLTADESADIGTPSSYSAATLAKHYKTLQSLYKRKNPNHQDVAHLLDMEFGPRRAFIDSNAMREEDRPEKILEAYPCFKDIGHVSHYLLCIVKTMLSRKMFKIAPSS